MTVPYTFANQTGTIPLAELDANFAAIPNVANTTITVTASAQPNITSVGTLTSLSVAGNTVTNLIFQKAPLISLGANAGFGSGTDTISIGNSAGNTNQNNYSIAIGSRSGVTDQGGESIAIGFVAGNSSQGGNAIAIGRSAGNIDQGGNAIAIGRVAGNHNQGGNAVALGRSAGNIDQGVESIAIGHFAGNNIQGANAIAIGLSAGANGQSDYAVAIGAYAGNNNQGSNSVAIGSFAGFPVTANNAIVINGGTTSLNAPESGLYIAPIRNDDSNVTNTIYYNTTTKELTYSTTAGSDYGNANVAAYLPIYSGNMLTLSTVAASGNITGNYLLGNGRFLTGITTSSSNILSGNSSINIPSPGSNIAVTVSNTVSATFFTSGMSLPGNVTTGNLNANYLFGNGSQLTSIIATSASTVTSSAQPNITSVGTLANVSVSGNINSNTIKSSATISLIAANAVNVVQSLFRLASFTTTQAANLTPQTGDMIFNSTLGNVQIYTGTKWGNIVVS